MSTYGTNYGLPELRIALALQDAIDSGGTTMTGLGTKYGEAEKRVAIAILENTTIGAGGVTALWGGITGNIANQTDLTTQLSVKANLSGATFTGNITATNISGTNTGDETTSTIQTKLGVASASTDGYLTSIDWNTFNNKQPSIPLGTTSQYYRGDKTFQTLDKTAVGLANVDNTSDVNKPVSTATQTAINTAFGNIATGQIAFGTGTNTIGGNANFIYNSGLIGINKSIPTSQLDVVNSMPSNVGFRVTGHASQSAEVFSFVKNNWNDTFTPPGDLVGRLYEGPTNTRQSLFELYHHYYPVQQIDRFYFQTNGGYSGGNVFRFGVGALFNKHNLFLGGGGLYFEDLDGQITQSNTALNFELPGATRIISFVKSGGEDPGQTAMRFDATTGFKLHTNYENTLLAQISATTSLFKGSSSSNKPVTIQSWSSNHSTSLLSIQTNIGTEKASITKDFEINGTIKRVYLAKTTSYTLTIDDDLVVFNGTSLTATLPNANISTGHIFEVVNKNISSLIIATTSSQTISGQSPNPLAQWEVLKVVSDGSNWIKI